MSKVYSNKDLMRLAIEEHLKCSEYPRVGAVVAKDGLLLSAGYRGEQGRFHAERVAIGKLNNHQLRGATLYTTLEPCITISTEQVVSSCTDLIVASGITAVVIGVLDTNGMVYSQGYRKLLQNHISVSFFSRDLRESVEEETFEYGDLHTVYGHGKRRVPVVHGGTSMNMHFSETDDRAIRIRWEMLQFNFRCVDLISDNGAVRVASGASNFEDITDPLVFRFPSHDARMTDGDIVVIKPPNATFCVLIKLITIYEKDILFQWQVRNDP
jgi:diaminohydroxyphosphoribosylaminopyrimidine deaminase/5-amino-6-(5-phosphoribosylamino)uracil reductase